MTWSVVLAWVTDHAPLITTLSAAVAALAALVSIWLTIRYAGQARRETKAMVDQLTNLSAAAAKEVEAESQVATQLSELASAFERLQAGQERAREEERALRDLEALRRIAEQLAEVQLSHQLTAAGRLEAARALLAGLLASLPRHGLSSMTSIVSGGGSLTDVERATLELRKAIAAAADRLEKAATKALPEPSTNPRDFEA